MFDVTAPPIPQAGGSKIVFASGRDGFMQIYVMNSDGTGQTRVTTDGSNNENPRWSPDGTKIVFQSDRDNPGSGLYDIYIMNANGSGQTRLTTEANDDCNASWSADGTKIVFQSFRNGLNYQIYTMNADGTGQTNISSNGVNDTQPAWSTGGKIAFASDRDQPGYPSIYWMNSNGTSQTRLTFSGTGLRDEQPVWSPNGTKLAFTSTRDSVVESWTETDDYEIPEDDGQTFPKSRLNINKEVYLMNADGSAQARLTDNLSNDDSPTWSPDGTKIVFRSERERDLFDPTPQIWTMNADGSGQINLSNSGDVDLSPSWTSGSANQPPVAIPGGPYSGVVGQNAPFNGSGSYDPDGSIVSYAWAFGDGDTGSGVAPTHAYATTGTFTITLTVTDNLGSQGSASTTISVSASSSDQFVASFLLLGLGRTPSAEESNYWTDILRAAYPRGLSSMQPAMRELGMTVFESAEYAARTRNDHWYVYDLYKTFLMREPDAGGWAHWEASVPVIGRAQVRRAFDESAEFANIVATLNASGSPSAAVSSLATARADLFNQSGNQLQARDAEWGVNLISLPGRAGLDLGLGLSYSSLVWTRSGPYTYFDADASGVSPGFHIGFPTIQEKYFDAKVVANVYLLTTAAGRKVELRQVGSSNVYESADSSYLQLTAGASLLLWTTDGTQMAFGSTGANEYRCTSILDRNGNYISVGYDWRGDIQTVADTLGRVIRFVYDANDNPQCITQGWNGQPAPTTCGPAHTWVSFGWENLLMQPSVSGVVGTYSGETIPVLKMVGFHDGTYTKFLYNGNGQVSRITQYASDSNPASDNHPRNYTQFDYDSATNDCPRLTATRTWAESWTGFNGVPAEVTTQFGVEGDKHTVTVVGDPNGTVYKEGYAGSADAAWKRGLVKSSEVWSASVQRKLSTVSWTQDNTNVNYKANPRVTETNVSDGSNQRRMTIGYTTFTLPVSGASCSLPNEVYEYGADQSTVLRRTHTDYNLDANYLNRRIIGLPDKKLLYEGMSALVAKTTFVYDLGGEYLQGLPATPIQHDGAYYSTDFVQGRANLVKVLRWDVNSPADGSKVTENKMGYDITGNVIFTRDALNHQTTISYGDSFSTDGVNLDAPRPFSTFAYPTTVTDADGFSSAARYRYDFGAKTRVAGPPPQNQPQGITQTFSYDEAMRLKRVTTVNTGAYVHYEYGPSYVSSFASVNNVAVYYWQSDSYTNQFFDGLGRVFAVASNHPNSTGGNRGQYTRYDQMGRAVQQTNPFEMDSGWNPIGDDATGYQFNVANTFDWQGRPVKTHNMDGTFKEASYSGCGCAGGEVVTLTDEGTLVDIDPGPGVNNVTKARQQKIFSDVLGRAWKTEVLNWEGPGPNGTGGSVYSTTVSVFNARDQVLIANQYSGSAPVEASSTNAEVSCLTGTCQKTSMAFDGYGRVQSKHLPQQNAGTATTWEYNVDDTPHKVTDARGASATYAYNNHRHLVNEIQYSAPGGITAASNVTYGYDAAGNRTSMTDGLGNVSYAYNQLSQMTSETRTFNDPQNPAINGVSKTISYGEYNLAGQLESISDHTNQTINYGFDGTGRLSSITGTNYSINQFINSLTYRASGSPKQVSYGNGRTASLDYNSRLQVSHFEIPSGGGLPPVMSLDYEYYADGHTSYSRDNLDSRFDRAYQYDHSSRISLALSGPEARGEAPPPDGARPYRETFAYDQFSHVTNRITRHWSRNIPFISSDSYTNNRRNGWQYDADGRLTDAGTRQYTFDAAGRMIAISGGNLKQLFDGNGRRVKTTESNVVTYYLRSTVLGGQVIAELDGAGAKQRGFVYAGGQIVAEQYVNGFVGFVHQDPSGVSVRKTHSQLGNAYEVSELDPAGADVETEDPYPNEPQYSGRADGGPVYPGFGNITDPSRGCTAQGIFSNCDLYSGGGASSFWGDDIINLPGFGTVWGSFAALEEKRYLALKDGFDPRFNRLIGTATVTVNGVVVQTIQNPTLDQYQQLQTDYQAGGQWETGYMPDSGSVDYATNTVTIFGGAPYFTQEAYPGAMGNVKIVKTGGDSALERNADQVRGRIMKMALSKNCNDAFKRAGLATPDGLVQKGIILASRKALTDPAYNSALGITEAIRVEANKSNAPLQTIRPQFTSSGKPVIIFAADAFQNNFLDEGMPHEFIHGAGVGQVLGFWGYFSHDLKGYDPYDDIIANCR